MICNFSPTDPRHFKMNLTTINSINQLTNIKVYILTFQYNKGD